MYFITGTDTDVGKTFISACLTYILNGTYWKPIQAGDLQTGGDTQRVKDLTGLSDTHFLSPLYNLSHAVSPHESARRDGITIDINNINLPHTDKKLIIEGAGGLMVPINQNFFMIDVIKKIGLPVILVSRTQIGTLNHTLLSVKMLRDYNIPIKGIILNGVPSAHVTESIKFYSKCDILAEIPYLESEYKTVFYAKSFFQDSLV